MRMFDADHFGAGVIETLARHLGSELRPRCFVESRALFDHLVSWMNGPPGPALRRTAWAIPDVGTIGVGGLDIEAIDPEADIVYDIAVLAGESAAAPEARLTLMLAWGEDGRRRLTAANEDPGSVLPELAGRDETSWWLLDSEAS